MRSYSTRLALVSLTIGFIGCGGQSQPPSRSFDLSLESTTSRVADIDASNQSQGKLFNTDFQTVRRLERYLPDSSSVALSSTEDLVVLAQKAAHDLNPETQLQLLHLRRGKQFAYATFQQFHADREIVGAKLVLRLNKSGDWISTNSTLVSPGLLSHISKEDSRVVDSRLAYQTPHRVLAEKSVIFPKLDESENMQFYTAKELTILDANKKKTVLIWINEQTNTVIAALDPQTDADKVTLVGSIKSKTQRDPEELQSFPSVTALFGGNSKTSANEFGQLNIDIFHDLGAQIFLENDYISVSQSNVRSPESWKIQYDSSESELPASTGTGFHVTIDKIDSSGNLNLNDGFSPQERNVYYWVMKNRDFVVNTLKYSGANFKLAAVTDDLSEADNASFNPTSMQLTFGAGGDFFKNTALSKSIIIHEYTHAITNAIYGYVFTYEFAAMNEAFSDYFAADMSNDPQIGAGDMQESTGLPYLRNVENTFKFPESYTGRTFHSDGQMFSGALWDIRKQLGAKKATQLIHEARLAQPRTIREFLMELLAIDENNDDKNPMTPSKNKKVITNSFFKHGLYSNISFGPKN